MADPQVLHRNMVVDLQHPNGESRKGPGNPIKLSRTGQEHFAPAPLLGQHTDEMLATVLGYDARRIGELRDSGVIR
jgi:crotonobetainyl-CoA:carnitine CoA-transferase CaiB-like acyl-CoA transferase